MDSFTTSASKVPDPPAEGGIERHGSVYGFDAEGEEGGEEPEAPPPPPEAVNLNTHLVGEGWLMKLSRQRKGMLQKRYFRVDGDSISHYAHNGKAKASKTPLMLADLRHIRIPSVEPALEGRGFDLIFVTRSITLAAIEEDRLSVAFSKLLRQAKVPASRGDHMESVTGAQLVLVKVRVASLCFVERERERERGKAMSSIGGVCVWEGAGCLVCTRCSRKERCRLRPAALVENVRHRRRRKASVLPSYLMCGNTRADAALLLCGNARPLITASSPPPPPVRPLLKDAGRCGE